MIREFKEKDAAAIAGIVSEAFSDEVLKGMPKLAAGGNCGIFEASGCEDFRV